MSICGISDGYAVKDCVNLGKSGLTGEFYLINKGHWLEATKTEDTTNRAITNVELTTPGSKAYKFDLTATAISPTVEMVINDGGKNGFKHKMTVFMPKADPLIKYNIESIVNFGAVVAIVCLDSDNVAMVYGPDNGLVPMGWTEAPNDPAIGGGFSFELSTSNYNLENRSGTIFFDGARASTLAKIRALTTEVSS